MTTTVVIPTAERQARELAPLKDQHIDAAKTASLLTTVNKPASEWAMRELAPLRDEPEKLNQVWQLKGEPLSKHQKTVKSRRGIG